MPFYLVVKGAKTMIPMLKKSAAGFVSFLMYRARSLVLVFGRIRASNFKLNYTSGSDCLGLLPPNASLRLCFVFLEVYDGMPGKSFSVILLKLRGVYDYGDGMVLRVGRKSSSPVRN